MQNPATATLASEFAELPATASHGPLRIEYRWVNEAAANAPIAVFLHEGLGSIAMWRDWPQALCERLGMRGLVYSRPGYGLSTPRAHDVKWPVDFMTSQARDILPALLDALDIGTQERKRMWVIGHSDGGSIALLYAAQHPDELAGAIAIAPHVFVEDISVESIAQTQATLRDHRSAQQASPLSRRRRFRVLWLERYLVESGVQGMAHRG